MIVNDHEIQTYPEEVIHVSIGPGCSIKLENLFFSIKYVDLKIMFNLRQFDLNLWSEMSTGDTR